MNSVSPLNSARGAWSLPARNYREKASVSFCVCVCVCVKDCLYQDVASCVAGREEDLHTGAAQLQHLGVGHLVRQPRDWRDEVKSKDHE